MTAKVADYLPRNISRFVPDMTFAADVDEKTGIYRVLIENAAAASAAAILSGTSINAAGTATTFLDDTDDTPFGRNVTVVSDGAATSTVTVDGRDYLGQKVKETLTLAGTTTVEGKKAFKYIDSIAYGLTSGRTINVGWGSRLGVPYASKALVNYFEGTTMRQTTPLRIPFEIEATELAAGTSEWLITPFAGYISKLSVTVQEAVTTGGDITVKVETVAVTGLTVSVANSATAGTNYTDTPTNAFSATTRVEAGSEIEIVPAAAFATAGAVNGFVEITPIGFTAYDTTTPTATTGDTRGTFRPNTLPDGSTDYELVLLSDTSNLHGEAHYYA